MDLQALRKQFGITGICAFDEHNGLQLLRVTLPAASATIYLQGAHLTAWQPSGAQPVIFTSRNSEYAPEKPIRGGVPIVFPWFAGDRKRDRIDGHPGPSHGFARISPWTPVRATHTGGEVRLRFELAPNDLSRSLGFDHFLLALEFRIGTELGMALTVRNLGAAPLEFEDCFHTYLFITDIHEVEVQGLEPTPFLDKTDANKLSPAANTPLRFTRTTDRIYNDTAAPIVVVDRAGSRRITLRKAGSNSTVTWNPWDKLPDLGPWEWHEMLAVETANIGVNSISLAPGASHIMKSHLAIDHGL